MFWSSNWRFVSCCCCCCLCSSVFQLAVSAFSLHFHIFTMCYAYFSIQFMVDPKMYIYTKSNDLHRQRRIQRNMSKETTDNKHSIQRTLFGIKLWSNVCSTMAFDYHFLLSLERNGQILTSAAYKIDHKRLRSHSNDLVSVWLCCSRTLILDCVHWNRSKKSNCNLPLNEGIYFC